MLARGNYLLSTSRPWGRARALDERSWKDGHSSVHRVALVAGGSIIHTVESYAFDEPFSAICYFGCCVTAGIWVISCEGGPAASA